MTKHIGCPVCEGASTEIEVVHVYTLKYDEAQDKWVKSEGDVRYGCGMCALMLDIHDIEDILREVDEL